jgi:pimeloyl-ACP methyl ester carboxylesterase
MHCLYLHGFGSGPKTAKGVALGQRLAGSVSSYSIPDLEGGSFTELTMDGIFARVEAAVLALPADRQPVLIIGSSLGGYVGAQMAASGRLPRVAGLLLIAPAFGFTAHWAERLGTAGIERWRSQGSLPFYHFAVERELPLGIGFYESCLALPELPGQASQAVTIVHGLHDETVDHRRSARYAAERAHVELHLVEGDHRLTEARHEQLIGWCAQDLLTRLAPGTAGAGGAVA